jgi:hypothetical protein
MPEIVRLNNKVQLVDMYDRLIWQIGLVCQQMFEGCRTFLIQLYPNNNNI